MDSRDAVSCRVDRAVGSRRLHDPVDSALDRVVAPPGEKIAGVDDTGVLDRDSVNEGTRRTLDLKPTPVRRG